MPRPSRTWASGTWSCSSAPTTRSDPADLAAQPGHRLGDLARVEGVVDPPVAGELLLEPGRQVRRRRVRHEPEPYAGQARRRGDEAGRGVEEVGRDEGGDDHDPRRYRECAGRRAGPGAGCRGASTRRAAPALPRPSMIMKDRRGSSADDPSRSRGGSAAAAYDGRLAPDPRGSSCDDSSSPSSCCSPRWSPPRHRPALSWAARSTAAGTRPWAVSCPHAVLRRHLALLLGHAHLADGVPHGRALRRGRRARRRHVRRGLPGR
jgi:hypothetical protein